MKISQAIGQTVLCPQCGSHGTVEQSRIGAPKRVPTGKYAADGKEIHVDQFVAHPHFCKVNCSRCGWTQYPAKTVVEPVPTAPADLVPIKVAKHGK